MERGQTVSAVGLNLASIPGPRPVSFAILREVTQPAGVTTASLNWGDSSHAIQVVSLDDIFIVELLAFKARDIYLSLDDIFETFWPFLGSNL